MLMPLLSACGNSTSHYQPPSPSFSHIALSPGERACLANLGERRAAFTALPDQYFSSGCAAINTVRLYGLDGDAGAISVANLSQVACPMAVGFAGWARYGVDRAARNILGSPVVQIETMGSFSCRNVAGTDRLSAHATGNAIDVSGFVLANGRRITVLGNWWAGTEDSRAFLQAIHQSACKRFGTVLGPDYNVAHRNHLHIELSGNGMCR